MLEIGIIGWSKRKEKKSLRSIIRHRKIKEQTVILGEMETKVLTFSCGGKNLEKKIEKAEVKLKDCSFVIKDYGAKNEKEFEQLKKMEKIIFLDLALRLYKEYLKMLSLKAYKMKVLIADTDCIAVREKELERLCFYSSSCDIQTKNIQKAEKLSEFIYDQNGFFVNVKEETSKNRYDIIIDVENKTLKVDKKIYINNIDLGLENFREFGINLFELKEKLERAGFRFTYNNTQGSTAYFRINKKNQQSY